MILNYQMGKVYDVIMFGNIWFNQDVFHEKWKNNGFGDSDKNLEFYNIVKERVPAIPEHLVPLFFMRNGRTGLLNEFFSTRIEKRIMTSEDFLNIIHEQLKEYIFEYFSAENEKFEAISEHIKYLLDNYDLVISDLVKSCRVIFKAVSDVYDENGHLINEAYNVASSIDVRIMLSKYRKIGLEDVNKGGMSFSLLDRYLLLFDNINDRLNFFLGINFTEPLSKATNNVNASYKHFLQVCSNPVRVEILELLHKYKELTVSDLCNILYTSSSTMLRHVNDLFYQSILIISRHESIKIYYTINNEYFKALKQSLSDFVDKLSGE